MRALIVKSATVAIIMATAMSAGMAQQALNPGVSRDVTPRGMTPAPQITAPLKRVPGVAPPEPQVRARNLYRIKVIDTATFEGVYLNRKWQLELPGVLGIARDDTCNSDEGTWPCGGFIIRSLQRHIRLTALNCAFAWQTSQMPLKMSCKLRGQDLAELVVSNGWAHAASNASDTLKDLAEVAKRKSLGIYQPPPPGWQNYRALTRQGSSTELPPPPVLPIADIVGPLREESTDTEDPTENLIGDQRSRESFID